MRHHFDVRPHQRRLWLKIFRMKPSPKAVNPYVRRVFSLTLTFAGLFALWHSVTWGTWVRSGPEPFVSAVDAASHQASLWNSFLIGLLTSAAFSIAGYVLLVRVAPESRGVSFTRRLKRWWPVAAPIAFPVCGYLLGLWLASYGTAQ